MQCSVMSSVARVCPARTAQPLVKLLGQALCSTTSTSVRQDRKAIKMAALQYPPAITIPAQSKQTATVIMLHGLGDTGEGWADVAGMFGTELPHVKFIFPTAPQRAITLNFGMRMTGWYDIASLHDINQQEDAEGLLESKRHIEGLVEQEERLGIPSQRIVVAGFSQGGAIALLMLRSHLKMGGVIGLSTYMPLRNQQPVVSDANKHTPTLLAHGDADQVVAYKYGLETYERLHAEGAPVEFLPMKGMPHTAWPTELQEVVKFLKQCLA